MKETVGRLLSALTGGPKDIVIELCSIGSEKISDQTSFKSEIDDFLEHIEDPIISNQMDCLLKEIRKNILKDAKDSKLSIFEELNAVLDKEMHEREMLQDIIEPLKKGLFACVLTYIHDKDVHLYNELVIKDEIEGKLKEGYIHMGKLDRKYTQLLTLILGIQEALVEQPSKSPLRKPLGVLCVDNPEKMSKREREKSHIQTCFDMGSNIVFLCGRPGMGKTTLAKLYANVCPFKEIYFEEYKRSMEYTISKLGKHNELGAKGEKIQGETILSYWESLDFEKRASILLIIDNYNGDTLQNGNEQRYTEELQSDFYKRLKDVGIHILITTRINMVSESNVEVGPVDNTMELFENHYRGKLTDEQRNKAKELIDIVQGNTLLIVQSADIWSKSDSIRKYELIAQLKNCCLKENDVLLKDKTLYEQIKAMLNFSGICTDEETSIIFASAALMPSSGFPRDKFVQMIQCDINKLSELIVGNWILIDYNENLSLHPVVKEVAVREGLADFEKCSEICKFISDALALELPLEDRYPYMGYAWEIYKIFSSMNPLNKILVRLFYRLSDIFDNTDEHERSMKIADTLARVLPETDLDIVEKARMLSGIAYSINNFFENMDELDKAENMLQSAQNIMRKLPCDRQDDLDVIKARVRVLSNLGSNSLAKSKCNKNTTFRYLQDALEWHSKALSSRQRYLEEMCTNENTVYFKKDVAVSYTTVATDYYYLGQYDKAIEFHLKAYQIRKDLKEENAMCINMQRVVGCCIDAYKKTLLINNEHWEQILSYYPSILEINYKFHSLKSFQTNIDNFRSIFEIIHNDRRLEQYEKEAMNKKCQIVEWIKSIEELAKKYLSAIN